MSEQTLIEKMRQLPPELLAEVERYVDALTRHQFADDESAATAGDTGAAPERDSRRRALDEAIRAFAWEHGGTELDLDPELAAAAVEFLHDPPDVPR